MITETIIELVIKIGFEKISDFKYKLITDKEYSIFFDKTQFVLYDITNKKFIYTELFYNGVELGDKELNKIYNNIIKIFNTEYRKFKIDSLC